MVSAKRGICIWAFLRFFYGVVNYSHTNPLSVRNRLFSEGFPLGRVRRPTDGSCTKEQLYGRRAENPPPECRRSGVSYHPGSLGGSGSEEGDPRPVRSLLPEAPPAGILRGRVL